jgi:glycosyltransferase involved in cell wall biosynthesis
MPQAEFAYLIRMFPQTSETFIASEILRVERSGLPLRVYSYRRPVEDVRHEVVRQIQSPVTYLPDPLWKHLPQLLRGAREMWRLEPARARALLLTAFRSSLRDRSVDVWKRWLQGMYLANGLRREGVRHVHAHFAHQATQVAMFASLVSGVPFSFTGHAKDVYTARKRDLRQKVAAASFVLTCTGANVSYLRSVAAREDREKVLLAYHGVDLEKFVPRPAGSIVGDPPLILSVGRLVAKKGYDDLLRSAAMLRDRGRALRLRIVGEGPERINLEKLRAELGLEGIVEFAGSRSQEDLIGIYQEATVFALACRVLDDGDRDGIPNVLMEAMATGLPVVSTDVSGISELIAHDEDGLLVTSRDVRALADAMDSLLDDARLRTRLGGEARRKVERSFDAETCGRQLAERYAVAAGWRAPVGVG